MKRSFVTPIVVKVARSLGLGAIIEPRYRYAGQIRLPSGRLCYFKGTSFDLNPLGASEIAKDKAYTAFFLRRLGYRTAEGQEFFTNRWRKIVRIPKGPVAAHAYARRVGFPLIFKPNSLSQGSGVCKILSHADLTRAVRALGDRDRVFLLQRYVEGHDYRIVVLDGRVISVYERTPLAVVGDGRSTVLGLLRRKQKQFRRDGRDTVITISDFRLHRCLARQRLSLDSVLPQGRRVTLLDNANLSTGGDARDVTECAHHRWTDLAVRVARDMGLRLCGVDLIIGHGIERPSGDYVVLEVNAAPGLDHYAQVGPRQQRLVESLYRQVISRLMC